MKFAINDTVKYTATGDMFRIEEAFDLDFTDIPPFYVLSYFYGAKLTGKRFFKAEQHEIEDGTFEIARLN